MARNKAKTAYLCSACGEDFPKWNGQCSSCKEWGTLSEFKISKNKTKNSLKARETKSLSDILKINPEKRISSGLNEADRVLGGGPMPGSLILLG